MTSKFKWINKNIQNTTLVSEILYNNLESSQNDCTTLKNYRQIASYSWSSKSSAPKPLIYIPGKPRVLIDNLDSILDHQLKKNAPDHKSVMDMNRFYLPCFPMEPIFRSTSLCSPDFSFSKINFITDRNNLRKLFSLVDKKAGEPFIIDLQKIGNSILMIRREKSSRVDNDTFGDDFENMASLSTDDYNGHRIIASYEFGNHQFLVRFEVDCVEENQDILNENIQYHKASNFSKLFYIQDGAFKPRTLVELTTRSNSSFPQKKWAQMFFSQTNNLVIGFHVNGKVNKIEKLNFDQINQRLDSRKNTQPVLGKLDNLLEEIKKIVEKDQLIYRLVYNHKEKSLKIFEFNSYRPNLPRDLLNQLSNANF